MTDRPTSLDDDLPNCCRVTEEIYERRLAELDAYARLCQTFAKSRDALRPPCPTCGGTTTVPCYADGGYPITMTERPCPDCVDGKVSIEQLVARWNAVQNYDTRLGGLHGEFGRGWQSCIHHLRQEPPR